jgi:hypothetical protein
MLMFWVQISRAPFKVMTPSPSFDDEFHELCCMNFDLAYLDNAGGILLQVQTHYEGFVQAPMFDQ